MCEPCVCWEIAVQLGSLGRGWLCGMIGRWGWGWRPGRNTGRVLTSAAAQVDP
jgi:hypothetical protein